MSQYLDRPIFKLVSETAAERGVRAFVIGGYVRDCLLGRECTDIDCSRISARPCFATTATR